MESSTTYRLDPFPLGTYQAKPFCFSPGELIVATAGAGWWRANLVIWAGPFL